MPHQVSIVLSIDGVALLKKFKQNGVYILKTKAIIFPANEITVAIFGAGVEGCFYWMDCLFVFGSKLWTKHLSWVRKHSRKPVWSASMYIFPWCAQLDALLIRYQKTGHPSGWKLCQFILQNVLSDFTGYANSIGLFIINRLSSVTMLWTQSMFSTVVSVAGHPDIGSSSRHSVPLLNSAALFCTVDKTGESSLM